MLVTRQCNTGRSTWSSSKLGALHQNPASPRMSNREQLATQPDWREQYSQYLPPSENTLLSPHFDQGLTSNPTETSTSERQFVARPQLGHRHSLALLDDRQDVPQTTTIDRPDSAPGNCGQQASNGLGQDPVDPAESTDQSLTSAPLGSTSPSVQPKDTSASQEDLKHGGTKEEDEEEDEDEDDDMLDAEDGGGPQTEAERQAERRKMKRFRLTHQQTRFLMSEFAKQAHPDAAHRERLSREIPGLSPRQVQVWFQNRRAKIKRLTADDRERMLKMRAVPDDFDNVQALHSPYGAVHGIGTPLQSPIDYASSYSEQAMMRPLMVDTMRRHESDDQHISPTGLSPAFGHVAFAPSGSMGTPDVLSPLSLASTDRYYGSHLSSPLSGGPRSANNFNRQNSSDSYQIHAQSRNPPRPLQPLQLRETMSRQRSHSLQSPLRSSMLWKGDALDYADYPAGPGSPNLTGRQQPQYQSEQSGSNPVSAHHYDANAYSNPNVHASPTHVAYPTSQPTPLQSPATTVPRFRSPSTAFPPGLDLRTQYRTLPSQQVSPHVGPPPTPRGSSFNSNFAASSTGFASAPLTAPSDFQLPRTPVDVGPRDYHMSQMSAPMAPPPDFTNAYNQIASPVRVRQAESALQTHQQQQQQQQPPTEGSRQEQSADSGEVLSGEHYGAETGHKRKRTYSMPLSFEGQEQGQ